MISKIPRRDKRILSLRYVDSLRADPQKHLRYKHTPDYVVISLPNTCPFVPLYRKIDTATVFMLNGQENGKQAERGWEMEKWKEWKNWKMWKKWKKSPEGERNETDEKMDPRQLNHETTRLLGSFAAKKKKKQTQPTRAVFASHRMQREKQRVLAFINSRQLLRGLFRLPAAA